MVIDFSNILSQEGKELEVEAVYESDSFKTKEFDYPISAKKSVKLLLAGMGKSKFSLKAETEITLDIPCSRCLEPVKSNVFINSSRIIDMKSLEEGNEDDDSLELRNFISGKTLDVDKFIYGEILVNLPMKVLCKEDCKGICNRCGMNLNHNECGCDTTELDPRMAKILDVFNSFKEV